MSAVNYAKENTEAAYYEILCLLEAVNCDFDRLNDITYQGELLAESEETVQELLEWDNENHVELDELINKSFGCTSRDEALERLTESAAELLVRSYWMAPVGRLEVGEYMIVLFGGVPTRRIVGKLEDRQVLSAKLEYLSGEWVELLGTDESRLIEYAGFFFNN